MKKYQSVFRISPHSLQQKDLARICGDSRILLARLKRAKMYEKVKSMLVGYCFCLKNRYREDSVFGKINIKEER